MLKTPEIKDLEKHYFEVIFKIISSDKFKIDLKKIETYIINNYNYLNDSWDEKNKLKVAAERLIRFYFYRGLNVLNIYPSPLSSDMAIELDDVILNIDAKTIDMVGNQGDDTSIHFQKNQITFSNKPFYPQKVSGHNFTGVSFPPRLEAYSNNKPCLTFFVTVNYFDDSIRKTFRLSHMSLCSVPHSQIVIEDFNSDIISNYKTYEYIGKVKAEEFGPLFAPLTSVTADSIGFSLKGSGLNDSYLDPNLDHPFNHGSKCVRKKISGKWQIIGCGGAARIDKTTITNRLDSGNKIWKGYKRIDRI
jgi:hypothetical protein